MKKIILVITIMIVATVTNCLNAQEAKNDLVSVYFKTNMTCDNCENTLFNQLRFEKGVKDLDIDLESNTIKVCFKKGKSTTEKIAGSIEKKGYEAKEITEKDYKKLISEKKAE